MEKKIETTIMAFMGLGFRFQGNGFRVRAWENGYGVQCWSQGLRAW